MSTCSSPDCGKPSHSAGEHQWRSIKVHIGPGPAGALVNLYVRKHRGVALEHERRLGWLHVAAGSLADTGTVAGILRAAGESLLAAADRLEDRS